MVKLITEEVYDLLAYHMFSKCKEMFPINVPLYNVGNIKSFGKCDNRLYFEVSDEDAIILMLSGKYEIFKGENDKIGYVKSIFYYWIELNGATLAADGIKIETWFKHKVCRYD